MPDPVVPLDRTRYGEAAAVLARAFDDDPVVLAILKGLTPGDRRRILSNSFAAALQACGISGCPLAVVSEGCIAGAAILHRPGGYPLPLARQICLLGKVLARGVTRPGAPAAFGRWLKWLTAIAKRHPVEHHFYVEFIGVDAPWRGKGLGSRMMQHLATLADEERRGCYLESGNSRNLSLYQRFAFRVVATETILGVPTWFLWRPPADPGPVDERRLGG